MGEGSENRIIGINYDEAPNRLTIAGEGSAVSLPLEKWLDLGKEFIRSFGSVEPISEEPKGSLETRSNLNVINWDCENNQWL